MKIPLNTSASEGDTPAAHKLRKLANDLAAARRSDWGARDRVVHHFTPLIRSLADRRTQDPKERQRLVEAGQAGLVTAISRFNPSGGPERFQLFALDYIEKRMDRPAESGGLLSRLLRRG